MGNTLLEGLHDTMASRMDQIESKVKRDSANVRREIETNSEMLRAISKRLGASTGGRLMSCATKGGGTSRGFSTDAAAPAASGDSSLSPSGRRFRMAGRAVEAASH